MSWVRIDDNMPDHPKIIGLSDKAFRAYVKGLCHAARFLTDGKLYRSTLSTIATKATRTELVEAGLWIELETGDVEIGSFLEYNRDAATVKEERRKGAERLRRWRERNAESNAVTDPVTEEESNALRNAVS